MTVNAWCPTQSCTSYITPEQLCHVCRIVYGQLHRVADERDQLHNVLVGIRHVIEKHAGLEYLKAHTIGISDAGKIEDPMVWAWYCANRALNR